MDALGWVIALDLTAEGVFAVVRTSEPDLDRWIGEGATLVANVSLDWVVKHDNSHRVAYLSEVLLESPPPAGPKPTSEHHETGPWEVRRVRGQSQRGLKWREEMEREIQDVLNQSAYKPEFVVGLADGGVLVIGRRFD